MTPAETTSVADVVGTTIAAQGVQGRVRDHRQRQPGRHQCALRGTARAFTTPATRAGRSAWPTATRGSVGRVGICSVHQGPGLTNTMTGLTEAAKSRTPLLVLAGETPAAALTSNFRIDQHDLVESVGAIADRVHSPKTAADDAQRAYQRAQIERRPVVLMLPIDIQPQPAATTEPTQPPLPPIPPPEPAKDAIRAAAQALQAATKRPRSSPAVARSSQAHEKPLKTLAADNRGDPRHVRSRQRSVRRPPLRARDLGRVRMPVRRRAATPGRHRARVRRLGQPLDDQARRADQPERDGDPDRRRGEGDRAQPPGQHRDHRRRQGDGDRAHGRAHRTRSRQRSASGPRSSRTRSHSRRWRHEPYQDASTDEWIDPRTLSIKLNEALPRERSIAVDSGPLPRLPVDVPRRP